MNLVCRNCSFSFEYSGEDIHFCPRCGSPMDSQAEPVSPSYPSSSPFSAPSSEQSAVPVQKLVCPVCCCEVTAEDASVQCPDCQMIYHQECWEGNGGCATYGCPSSGCLNPPPEKIEVPAAGGPGEAGNFGAAGRGVPGQTLACPHCGTVLSPEATFCWACGQDVRGRLVAGSYGGAAPVGDASGKQKAWYGIWWLLGIVGVVGVVLFACAD